MERVRALPAARIAAVIVWGLGWWMTANAFDQMTAWGFSSWIFALGVQLVLTIGQSAVWKGKGTIIAYALLAVDAGVNFGGVHAIMVNIDQVGSVQAITSAFGYSGDWHNIPKLILSTMFSVIVAGLPEHLWREG